MEIEDMVLGSNSSLSMSYRKGLTDFLTKLENGREKVLANAKKKISFSKPILYRDGNPFVFPNTINIIQGKSGVHKSRLVEIMASCLLSQGKTYRLGFQANEEKEFHILYVDTERNLKEQFPYAVQQIKRLAGFSIEDEVEWLDPISLIDIPREKRFAVLDAFLNHLRLKLERHLIVILDVVTDCVEDFNSSKKSMELIDLMNVMINEHDLTFFCVIHENPNGGDKARGHLGTELNNKSSATLQIKFETDSSELLKVTLLKGRTIKGGNYFHLTYSDEEKTLVLADQSQVRELTISRQEKAPIKELGQKLLEAIKAEPASRKSLVALLKEHFNCGGRIIEERIKFLLDDNQSLFDDEDNEYILDKFKEGRNVFYGLKKIENELV